MPEENIDEALTKAQFFFERAEKAVRKKDFDGAINMYLEGLRWAPDAVEKGHIGLRDLAVLRQAEGGKKASRAEAAKRLQGKTPLEQMLGAEYLLAKDPSDLPYGEAVLKAAVAGGYKETAKWIADLVFLANKVAKKPSLEMYLLLKDSYSAIGRFDRAFAACECATRLKPEDKELEKELQKLSEKRMEGKDEFDLDGDLEESLERGQRQGGEVDGGAAKRPFEGMVEEYDPALARARDSFDKARQVAALNDFDYAIELYLKGLRWAPDALEEGHLPLCELALERQRRGRKKPSMMERAKRLRGKTPLEQMLNAEYLFAKDPDHLPYGEAMLKAAVSGGYRKTANWIANYVFQGNNAARKPSLRTYVLLKDSYAALGQFDRALAACQCAARLKPDDATIADELKNLTAELTVSRGKYDQEGDFRQSIKDREWQEKLQSQESVVKTEDYRVSAVEEAREAFARDGSLAKNIFNLAGALSDLENDKADREALKLLENAYKTKSDFSYKQRAGQIRIKHVKRKIREAKGALETKPDEAQARARVAVLSAQLNNIELEHFRLCVENYPTDLQAKYEYGIRLLRDKQYDEAIPLFQEAQKDPRRRISAMDKIGFCFFKKGWFADAIDVFTKAIESHKIRDDGIAKELRYNLARSYEEQGDKEEALEIYRKIAQLDFAFKDVRQRVDKLRSKGEGPAPG